jgi:hypothetical protein
VVHPPPSALHPTRGSQVRSGQCMYTWCILIIWIHVSLVTCWGNYIIPPLWCVISSLICVLSLVRAGIMRGHPDPLLWCQDLLVTRYLFPRTPFRFLLALLSPKQQQQPEREV